MKSPWAAPNDQRIAWVNDGPDCYCADCGKRLVWYSCPECDRDPAPPSPFTPEGARYFTARDA